MLFVIMMYVSLTGDQNFNFQDLQHNLHKNHR